MLPAIEKSMRIVGLKMTIEWSWTARTFSYIEIILKKQVGIELTSSYTTQVMKNSGEYLMVAFPAAFMNLMCWASGFSYNNAMNHLKRLEIISFN